jgi:hypothetical protein
MKKLVLITILLFLFATFFLQIQNFEKMQFAKITNFWGTGTLSKIFGVDVASNSIFKDNNNYIATCHKKVRIT